TFRWDQLLLQVTSTFPSAGSTITLGSPTFYDLIFNESVSPSSVQTSDLVLSGIPGVTVTGATILGLSNDIIRFTLSGGAGEGTLTTSIAAGAITDAFGNPGAAFSASFPVDVANVGYPTPLVALAPPGSLIYDPPVSGSIRFAGDTDSYNLFGLDAPQTLTVVVTPTSPTGLTPSVRLTGPNGTTLGTASATAPGQKAVIQTIPITSSLPAGLYTITISGVSGSTGGYTA